MPFFPDIPTWDTATFNTTTFLGLNRGLSIEEGEMADMLNMSSDNYPVLSTRRPRGVVQYPSGDAPIYVIGKIDGMLGTDKLIYCWAGEVRVDGELVPITLSTEEHMLPKQMVAMGAYVCIFPDKKYFNVTNPEDCGDMGSLWTAPADASISAMMCRKDGTNYDAEDITVFDTAPAEPVDQQLWLDTSGENDVLKQYSEMYAEWIQVASTYIKLQADGIGKGLKESDVVHLSGVKAVAETTDSTEATEDTLSFSVADFHLYSNYKTTHYGGTDYRHTTASTGTATKTITVEGIPDGAAVKSAVLKFSTKYTLYGAAVSTVNGEKFSEGKAVEIPATVEGNGEVSFKFAFKSRTTATVSGTHTGTLSFSGMVLEVTYETAGSAGTSEADAKQLEVLNTTNAIYGCGEDYIIVAGLLHEAATLQNTLTVELKIPDLDYVCEANNRLWGCSYATVDGQLTNEIRCCALGDFRNWYKFEGTSMDSYVLSVGSDGPFTGAYSLQGVPLLWKEDYLHKISGTTPSNFTLNTIKCRGVQDGSWQSLAVVNETLFYKARNDVMAYDGAMPYSVSEKLGTARYSDAVGGACRDKYYISMRDEEALWHLYVLDTARGMWHKEDEAHMAHMATVDGTLVMAKEDEVTTFILSAGGPHEADESFNWSVTFGKFGYAYERAKYLSRFNIRAQMEAGSEMHFYIQYDSNGTWEHMGTMRSPRLQTFLLPIIPRRCDHCQVKISGKGRVNIYSIARLFEEGGN